jgi:hypothetical protein
MATSGVCVGRVASVWPLHLFEHKDIAHIEVQPVILGAWMTGSIVWRFL